MANNNSAITKTTGTVGATYTGQAWKDSACTDPYNLTTDVTKIELMFKPPRNRGDTIGPVTANVTNPNGNDFDYTDTTNITNIQGYWLIQPILYLVTGEIIPLQCERLYVGKTIIPALETEALLLAGQTLLLDGEPLLLK